MKPVSVPILCILPTSISIEEGGEAKEFSSVQELLNYYIKKKVLSTPIARYFIIISFFHFTSRW